MVGIVAYDNSSGTIGTKLSIKYISPIVDDSQSDHEDVSELSREKESDFFGFHSTNVDECDEMPPPPPSFESVSVEQETICNITYDVDAGPSRPEPRPLQNDNCPSVQMPVRRLNDEDALKLIKRFEAEPFGLEMKHSVDIVDFNANEMVAGARENVLRGLSSVKTPLPAKLKGEEEKPTIQAKRKHQITYLAHVAREREGELEQQWAHNRLRRREARVKYGF